MQIASKEQLTPHPAPPAPEGLPVALRLLHPVRQFAPPLSLLPPRLGLGGDEEEEEAEEEDHGGRESGDTRH